MPSIRPIDVLVDESEDQGELTNALCDAAPGFLPVALDMIGTRDGKDYRYASIGSIRRSIFPACHARGIWIDQLYADESSNDGYTDFVVTVVRHGPSNQKKCSKSRVPYYPDADEHKAACTKLCKKHLEGLFGIVTEEDNGEKLTAEATADAATSKLMAKARLAVESAKTYEEASTKMVKVRQHIEKNELPADADEEFMEIVRRKFNVKEVANA